MHTRMPVTCLIRIIVASLVFTICGTVARAQCPVTTMPKDSPASSAIFAGIAINIRGLFMAEITTFDVERIWKGTPGKRITVSHWHSSESLRLEKGARYLVYAGPRRPFPL